MATSRSLAATNCMNDRVHKLRWNATLPSHQDFVDGVCLLSGLDKQQRPDEQDEKFDADPVEDLDEWNDDGYDFDDTLRRLLEGEQNNANECTPATVEALKDQFLDRLAEILAREKGSKQDSRQVTSAYLVEFDVAHGTPQAQVRIAKNQGVSGTMHEYICSDDTGSSPLMSASDMIYLGKLRRHIKKIAHGELSEREGSRALLEDALDYAGHRVQYYIKCLRDTLGVTSPHSAQRSSKIWDEITKNQRSHGAPKWDGTGWEFLCQPDSQKSMPGKEQPSNSTESDKGFPEERFRKTEEVVTKVLDFFKSSQADSVEDLVELIEAAHLQQLDIKSRAVFVATCYRSFATQWRDARRAVQALLFLCRFQSAALTFVKAARFISSFSDIEFVAIDCLSPEIGLQCSGPPLPVYTALRTVKAVNKATNIKRLFGHDRLTVQRIDEQFNFRRKGVKHIHAEIQLIDDYEHRVVKYFQECNVHRYLGCSKLCCHLCDAFIREHGVFKRRGSHFHIAHLWTVPGSFASETAADRFSVTLANIHAKNVEKLRAFTSGAVTRSPIPLRPESTLGRTTAVTLSQQDAAEMTLESRMTSYARVSKGAYGPSVCDDAVLVVPGPSGSGKVTLTHCLTACEVTTCEVTPTFAEDYKDRYERMKYLGSRRGLKALRIERFCHNHNCKNTPQLKCTRCKTDYCSQGCRENDWYRHVFVCGVPKRPSVADYLVYILTDHARNKSASSDVHDLYASLLSDFYVAKTFGFWNCSSAQDFQNLVNWYQPRLRKANAASKLQKMVDNDTLFPSFNQSILKGELNLPLDEDGQFPFGRMLKKAPEHVLQGIYEAVKLLIPGYKVSEDSDYQNPSKEERTIIQYYSIICRDFNNIPKAGDSQWLDFGFWSCPTNESRLRLREKYLELANCSSLPEIVAH